MKRDPAGFLLTIAPKSRAWLFNSGAPWRSGVCPPESHNCLCPSGRPYRILFRHQFYAALLNVAVGVAAAFAEVCSFQNPGQTSVESPSGKLRLTSESMSSGSTPVWNVLRIRSVRRRRPECCGEARNQLFGPVQPCSVAGFRHWRQPCFRFQLSASDLKLSRVYQFHISSSKLTSPCQTYWKVSRLRRCSCSWTSTFCPRHRCLPTAAWSRCTAHFGRFVFAARDPSAS